MFVLRSIEPFEQYVMINCNFYVCNCYDKIRGYEHIEIETVITYKFNCNFYEYFGLISMFKGQNGSKWVKMGQMTKMSDQKKS